MNIRQIVTSCMIGCPIVMAALVGSDDEYRARVVAFIRTELEAVLEAKDDELFVKRYKVFMDNVGLEDKWVQVEMGTALLIGERVRVFLPTTDEKDWVFSYDTPREESVLYRLPRTTLVRYLHADGKMSEEVPPSLKGVHIVVSLGKTGWVLDVDNGFVYTLHTFVRQ